ncbi:MAG: fumarylacetoacetase [Gammaproteobacteria bacterium]|nr:fumarylacetoacetase [Gammaproteobacteria bacterium]MCH9744024.1 fumarylacetoacetase [Gammaproteobacteria bacterium]
MTLTIDPNITSYIDVAKDSDFPIQNLPFGIFKPTSNVAARVGVALGDFVIDLSVLAEEALIKNVNQAVFKQSSLNSLFELGANVCRDVRRQLVALLKDDSNVRTDVREKVQHCLHQRSDVISCVPVKVGDYTDFYSSEQHAMNVGSMFRGKGNELMPNWKHMPIGYHGRSSSIITTDVPVKRPCGQIFDMQREMPVFGPSKRLDFELEMGFFTAKQNRQGTPISIKDAEGYIIGLVLVNDWSARDIQKWEYQPLGPFLAKSFATSISPWVVMTDALEPFRIASPKQDPSPMEYLQHVREDNSFDIHLDVSIQSEKMQTPETICSTNFQYLYWSMAQQLAHHTIAGCNISVGDLMASGTISGPTREQFGSLLEISWGGKTPIKLTSGEERSFIENGDTIVMHGYCKAEHYRIGFGELKNQVVAND